MRSIAGLVLLILSLPAIGQRAHYGGIKGTVIDSSAHQPIEAATVSVFLIKDSTLLNYSITNKKGEFSIGEIPVTQPCRLMISCSGFNTFLQELMLSAENKELSLPAIRLGKAFREMEEVVVSAQRPPVIIKKDTVEFNAGSFKTPVNGVVEDLLRQLPGVEVDAEGNITINGKKVSKITVDGKDFFGGDFKITTKNLPRDIIDKVQVVDFKSREAQFNKTTTGNEDKAINLTLKKGKNKGVFGRVSTGYGSEKRHESGASLNYFNGTLQLNFIGYYNNTNRNNIAGDFSMAKTTSSLAGGGSGLSVNKAAGLNFSSELSKKLKLNGSYFYNDNQTTNNVASQRQNVLPDTSFLYNSSSQNINSNEGHRAFVNMDYKPDSTIDVYANASYNLNNVGYSNHTSGVSATLEKQPINAANNLFSGTSTDKNASLEVFFGHRLHKRGRSVTFNMLYNYGDRTALESNYTKNTFYNPDGSFSGDTLDQHSRTVGKNDVLNFSTSWTEPLTKQLNIVFRYNYTSTSGNNDKNTNRFNVLTGKYDIKDSLYSNSFSNSSFAHAPNLSFIFNNSQFNLSVGSGLQWLKQDNFSGDEKTRQVQRYTSIFPNANVSYRISKTGNIAFNYNGRSQQPSVQQLQPVTDNSNPLYIREGNPDLKPSFYHNINVNIQDYDSKTYLNGNVGVGIVKNQIVYETWFDSVQFSKPINTDGNYNVNYNLNYSRGWKRPSWSLRITLGNSGAYNRSVSITSKVENITSSYSISQRVGFNYSYKEIVTFMPTLFLRYNNTRYSIQGSQNTKYITKGLTVNTFVNWPQRFILENNLQYNYNSQTAPGFPKGITIWNVAVNYQVFKKRQGIIRLAIYDLLKQNTSVYRTITPTYIEDTQVQVLKQYGLLSFIYNLKQFGK